MYDDVGKWSRIRSGDMKFIIAYPQSYLLVDLTSHLSRLNQLKVIYLMLQRNIDKTGILVNMVYKPLFTQRDSNWQFYRGSWMVFTNRSVNEYNLEIDEDVRLQGSSCKIYENDFGLKTCDDQFMRSTLDSIGWVNVTPIWAFDDLTKVTKMTGLTSLIHESSYKELFRLRFMNIVKGVTRGPCPLPCTRMSVRATLGSQYKLHKSFARIVINIPDTMKRTREEKISLSPLALLSLMGGNLGLWLGISFVQLLKIVYRILFK